MSTPNALPVSDLVNVTINLPPPSVSTRNFGAVLAVGSSDVIDVNERIRSYSSLSGVATDFGTSAPEYLYAQLHFGQSPTPSILYIGRWAQTATSGILHGGTLSTTAQALANFTAVTAGKLTVTIDGTPKAMTAIDLSAQTNLNGVAAVITTKLGVTGTCTWNAAQSRFDITSATTGSTSTLSFPATVASDQNLSTVLGLNQVQGASLVDGIAAETLLSAVTTLADKSNDWYFLGIAATGSGAAAADQVLVAGFIEGAVPVRVFGVSSNDSNILSASATTDIAYQLKALNYRRSFVQYGSTNSYVVASLMARASTVDFSGNNTTITLMFKQEPGVTAEVLTESQAQAAKGKNCNVFAAYNNDTNIIQFGTVAAGFYIDEIQGADWLQNDLQTRVYGALYAAPKIPQTDAGVTQLISVCEQGCDQAVANGFVAPGVWTGSPVGVLKPGDTLSKGYYVYAPSVASQSSADRAARKSPPITVCIKLAGAIQSVTMAINVNR